MRRGGERLLRASRTWSDRPAVPVWDRAERGRRRGLRAARADSAELGRLAERAPARVPEPAASTQLLPAEPAPGRAAAWDAGGARLLRAGAVLSVGPATTFGPAAAASVSTASTIGSALLVSQVTPKRDH